MYILDEGRAAFLDFLRNLTPQVLLLSLALVIGTKLDFDKVDVGNWLHTLTFLSIVITAVLAGCANTTLFISKFTPLQQLRHDAHFVGPRYPGSLKTFRAYVWSRKKDLLELVFIVLLVELSIVAIFIHSICAASKMSL